MFEWLLQSLAWTFVTKLYERAFTRQKSDPPLVFVTANRHKLQEYRSILGLESLQSSGFDLEDIADVSLDAVAKRKVDLAKAKPELKKTSFFVEASGLKIDAWNGLPGGLTKYFVDQVRTDGICKMMVAFAGDERAAEARTVLYLCNKGTLIGPIVGSIKGFIAEQPCGAAGFGWDSIFIPDGQTAGARLTYAELGQELKNKMSPRHHACIELKAHLKATGLLR
jgi:XTP/dITP diphosphohydrolase